MDRIVDEIIILALCLPLVFSGSLGAFSVAGVLTSVAVVCACELISPTWARALIIAAYLVAAAFFAPLFSMLPTVVYQCVRQPLQVVRFVWIVVAAVGWVTCDSAQALSIFLLCAVATVMSVRTGRSATEKRAMRRVRDSMREQLLGAERSVESLEQAQSAAEALASNEVPRPAPLIDGLTEREQAVASLVAEGLDNKEIAAELYLSEGTVRNHISSILQKCHLKNRTQIAIMYLTELYS